MWLVGLEAKIAFNLTCDQVAVHVKNLTKQVIEVHTLKRLTEILFLLFMAQNAFLLRKHQEKGPKILILLFHFLTEVLRHCLDEVILRFLVSLRLGRLHFVYDSFLSGLLNPLFLDIIQDWFVFFFVFDFFQKISLESLIIFLCLVDLLNLPRLSYFLKHHIVLVGIFDLLSMKCHHCDHHQENDEDVLSAVGGLEQRSGFGQSFLLQCQEPIIMNKLLIIIVALVGFCGKGGVC